MAVEIKEVIIRAILEEDEGRNREVSAGMEQETAGVVDQDALVEMCVEQVLKILRRKNYR